MRFNLALNWDKESELRAARSSNYNDERFVFRSKHGTDMCIYALKERQKSSVSVLLRSTFDRINMERCLSNHSSEGFLQTCILGTVVAQRARDGFLHFSQ